MNQKIVCAAIIEKKGLILIAKRHAKSNEGGFWEFPGGKVEYLEHPEKCIIREIREELNIKIKVEQVFDVNTGDYIKEGKKVHLVLIFYLAKYVSGKLKLNDHEEIKWVKMSELKKYNFNFFDIANNHITDQGTKGLSETRRNLTQLGFNYSGSADAQVDDNSLYIKKIKDQNVAFVGLSMVYHEVDLAKAKALIKDAQSKADLVVVNLHWGKEYQLQFNDKQQTLAHSLIESGADLIIGTHPHVVQGMEVYQGKPIFYSLGNFIFDQYWSVETQRELALGIDWQTDRLVIKFYPLQSIKSVPSLMTGKDKSQFIADYIKRSKLNQAQIEQVRKGELVIE